MAAINTLLILAVGMIFGASGWHSERQWFLGQLTFHGNGWPEGVRQTVPYDPYHALHTPEAESLHPRLSKVPPTSFNCHQANDGYHADTEAQCQAFHLCQHGVQKGSFLCPNGTLFHDQFGVCSQWYNVRCGSPYEDL